MDRKDRVTRTVKETSCGVSGLFGCRVGLSHERARR